jgi:tetratricopeptide (TPR) repeat protein
LNKPSLATWINEQIKNGAPRWVLCCRLRKIMPESNDLKEMQVLAEVTDSLEGKIVDRNLKGIELEKLGKEDQAIALYEANVADQFDGSHPYNRLRIIYKSRGCYPDAIRVCEAYILNSGQDKKLCESFRTEIGKLKSKVPANTIPVKKTSPQPNKDAERVILRERFGQEPSGSDVKWSILVKQSLAHAIANNWGLYTNVELEKADFVFKEGKLEWALVHYLWVCHLDLNEPNNYGNLDKELRKEYPPFGPKLGILAPVITEKVQDISNDLSLDTEALRAFYFEHVGMFAKGIANILPRSIDETWGLLAQNLAD